MSMIKELAELARMKPAGTGSNTDGPPPAASLSAAMVRRGNNPWWRKDQPKPAQVTKPKIAAQAANIRIPVAQAGKDAPAWHPPRPLRARALLAREERLEGASEDADLYAAEEQRPNRTSLAIPAERDMESLFENLPTGLLRDIGIFFAIFAVACAAMLYLSIGAS